MEGIEDVVQGASVVGVQVEVGLNRSWTWASNIAGDQTVRPDAVETEKQPDENSLHSEYTESFLHFVRPECIGARLLVGPSRLVSVREGRGRRGTKEWIIYKDGRDARIIETVQQPPETVRRPKTRN